MAEPIIKLGLYETKTIMTLTTRGPGVYEQKLYAAGNSLLSSLFIESGAGTVVAEYFDYSTGGDVGEEYQLETHVQPAIGETNRMLVTRIHDKPVLRVTVTGTVRFGIYITVVASFASDLDSALVLDGATWNPASDKGLAIMCLDRTIGEFDFIPCENGALKVTGTVTTVAGGVTTPKNTTAITSATPDTETSVALAAVKRFRITNRGNAVLKYSFLATESGTNYASLYPNGTIEEEGILSANVTIYMQSPNPSQRVELVSWT